jgi:hypothetical protein
MSTLAHDTMTNHHGWGLVKQVSDTLHAWRDRGDKAVDLLVGGDKAVDLLVGAAGLEPATRPL